MTTTNPYAQSGGDPPNPNTTPVGPVQGYEFVLSAFNTTVQLTQALMDVGETQTILDASAVAVYNISIDDVLKIFKFSSTSWDITDNTPDGELHYFVHADEWPVNLTLNPSNSMLDQPGSLSPILYLNRPAEMLVKHDFVRYLAQKLFNTPMGVDLFSNQHELIADLNTKGVNVWQNDISANLWKYSATNINSPDIDETQGILIDFSSNELCTTDTFTSKTNLCRELYQQLVNVQRSRFQNVTIDAEKNQAPIPFIVGDSISYLYTITPANKQEELTGVPPFGPRSYRIKLQIVAPGSVVNTTPLD